MQTSKPITEQLHTQLNVEEPTNKNYPLIEREQIPGSPYWAIGNKEKGYFLAFGKYQLSEPQETALDVQIFLEENKWDIILKTILAVITETKEEEETENKN